MSSREKISARISPISYPHPLWRYVLIFQSWSQLGSWLIIVLLSTLLMYGFVGGLKEPPPVEGLLFGVALGSLISVFMVVPAQFKITANCMDSIGDLFGVLKGLHYVESHRTPDAVVYRQKLPRFLRWREGEMVIRRNAECIVINGPRAVLGRVRAELIRKF